MFLIYHHPNPRPTLSIPITAIYDTAGLQIVPQNIYYSYTIFNNISSQLENTEQGGRYDIYRWDLIVCGLILCGTIFSVMRSDCSIG